jgi:hypothetical protein
MMKVMDCVRNKCPTWTWYHNLFRCLPGIHAETPYNAIHVNAVYVIVNHFRLLTRAPAYGFSAPLPLDLGKAIWCLGFLRSSFLSLRRALWSLGFGFGFTPSTSMSIKSQSAFRSHSTSAVEADQRQTRGLLDR